MATMRRAPPPDGALLSPSFSSSFSTRYGMHQMLESPLPSPALPSIIPRHGKKAPQPPYVRRAFRWVFAMLKWILGLGIIYWILAGRLRTSKAPTSLEGFSLDEDYTVMEDGVSLETPMPIVISDKRGAARWTISLPSHLDYPLKPSEYASICSRSDGLAKSLRHLDGRNLFQQARCSQDYYYVDPNFMDIREAEEHGLLSSELGNTIVGSSEKSNSKHLIEEGLEVVHAGDKGKICEKSLTYVLETTDAGIGKTLMGLWIAYGLAKEENRAFFIDDTHW